MMSGIAPGLVTFTLCVHVYASVCFKTNAGSCFLDGLKIKQCSNFAQTSVNVPGQVWKLKNRRPVRVALVPVRALLNSGKVGHRSHSIVQTHFYIQNEIKQDLDLSKPLLAKNPTLTQEQKQP